jgi:hypothetical protein
MARLQECGRQTTLRPKHQMPNCDILEISREQFAIEAMAIEFVDLPSGYD